MKIASLQFNSIDDEEDNRLRLENLIRQAAGVEAKLVVLPEVAYYRGKTGTAPGDSIPGRATSWLAPLARELGVWIHGGSGYESPAGDDPDRRFFNTTFVLNPEGNITATYRKIHLFDTTLPGNTVSESKHMRPGAEPVMTEVAGFRAGLVICYDLRFPEVFSHLREKGAEIFLLPANFTKKTGEAHWEVLLRARAIENQCYVVASGQWGVHKGVEIEAYGRSMIVDPWGRILSESVPNEDSFAIAEISREALEEIRTNMPVFEHRRPGLFGI